MRTYVLPAAVLPVAMLALVLAPAASSADTAPVRASYTGYIAGMPVLELSAEFSFGADGRYRVATTFRTRGIIAAFVSGQQLSTTEGIVPRDPAQPLRPERYSAEGQWNGNTRRIQVEYVGGAPVVRALEPPNTNEREPVSAAEQQNTVDVLTALAGLTRAVQVSGRCEGSAATFDGRRRTDFTAATLGTETLAQSSRGIFAGEATACRFEGRQVAGFHRTWDRAEAEKPRHGRAWIARPLPGAPPVPVRMEVENGYFGTAILHLTRVERVGSGAPSVN